MAKCCQYNAGQLREPVEFQEMQTVDIGGGATERQFVTKFTTRGYMKPMSGSERLYAERLDAQTRNRLVIRYRADVTESDRVIIRGRAYQVRFISNVEFRNRWLEIDLDGGVAQ
jgi:SPP1 family predicted phage head-tail adaptor